MESQPNLPQPEFPYHPKHHIRVYVWIALVVASILLSINGYLYFLRLSYLEQGANTAQQNEQRIQELRVQRLDTSDWQTYHNEEYGFEVRYPSNWTRDSGNLLLFEGEATYYNSILFHDSEQGTGFNTIYRISVYYVPGKSLNMTLKSPIFQDTSTQINNITFAGTGGVEVLYESAIEIKYLVLSKEGNTFIVRIDKEGLLLEDKKEIDQILSTFRFINIQGAGTLTGKVSIGPNCPVEREGVACTPSSEAYASREFIVLDSNQKEVTRFHADANGNYIVTISEGTYTVKSANTGMGYMSKDLPNIITIKAGQTTTLNIDIDTGIR